MTTLSLEWGVFRDQTPTGHGAALQPVDHPLVESLDLLVFGFSLPPQLKDPGAFVLPDSESVCMRERRTPTSENSEATKKPLAKTRRKTMTMYRTVSISNES